MKYRAVANGNIVDDVPKRLVAAGIYVPVEDDQREEGTLKSAPPPSDGRDSPRTRRRRR